MYGTSLTDIANSIIAELKEEGIEPTLENITDRLNKHINLSELAGRNLDDIKMEKICKNCEYYRNKFGYGQCYGQKNAPQVDDNKCCEGFKARIDKINSANFIKAFGEGVKQMENVKPIVIDCKYYLPCGRCDKTNGFCSQLDEIGLHLKPNVTISPDNPFYAPTDNGGVTPV